MVEEELLSKYTHIPFARETIPEVARKIARLQRKGDPWGHDYILSLDKGEWYVTMTDIFDPFTVEGTRYSTVLALCGVDTLPMDPILELPSDVAHYHHGNETRSAMMTQLKPAFSEEVRDPHHQCLFFTIFVDRTLCPDDIDDRLQWWDFWERTEAFATEFICCAYAYKECRADLEAGRFPHRVEIPRHHPNSLDVEKLICSELELIASLKLFGYMKHKEWHEIAHKLADQIETELPTWPPFWLHWARTQRVDRKKVARRLRACGF